MVFDKPRRKTASYVIGRGTAGTFMETMYVCTENVATWAHPPLLQFEFIFRLSL